MASRGHLRSNLCLFVNYYGPYQFCMYKVRDTSQVYHVWELGSTSCGDSFMAKSVIPGSYFCTCKGLLLFGETVVFILARVVC